MIGQHINTTKGFVSSVDHCKTLGLPVMQLFLGSPRTYKKKEKSQADLQAILKKSQEHNIKIIVHASYLINLSQPSDSLVYQNGVKMLTMDVKMANIMNADTIVHLGKSLKLSTDDAVKNYIYGIREVIRNTSDCKNKILIETSAAQGTEICSNISELGKLYKQFTSAEQERLGICIDTCHVFSAGYDLSTEKTAKEFIALFDKEIGMNVVRCIHLNDSVGKLSCHLDRHADIGVGHITKTSVDGLKYIVKYAIDKKTISIILETHGDKILMADQFKMIKSWV